MKHLESLLFPSSASGSLSKATVYSSTLAGSTVLNWLLNAPKLALPSLRSRYLVSFITYHSVSEANIPTRSQTSFPKLVHSLQPPVEILLPLPWSLSPNSQHLHQDHRARSLPRRLLCSRALGVIRRRPPTPLGQSVWC